MASNNDDGMVESQNASIYLCIYDEKGEAAAAAAAGRRTSFNIIFIFNSEKKMQ